MKQFVFVFRGGRELTEIEAAQRTKDVGEWARASMASGSGLDPRVFRGDKYLVNEDSAAQVLSADDRSAIALNFITASDLDEAVRIAKTHPGLRYGVSLEVSEWFSPLAPAD